MGTFDHVLGSMRLGLVGTFGFMLGGRGTLFCFWVSCF
jgi:hypothetical protein